METALQALAELKNEIESSNYRSNFVSKLSTMSDFIDRDLDRVIGEVEDGITENERLQGELEDALARIEELEREINEAV